MLVVRAKNSKLYCNVIINFEDVLTAMKYAKSNRKKVVIKRKRVAYYICAIERLIINVELQVISFFLYNVFVTNIVQYRFMIVLN